MSCLYKWSNHNPTRICRSSYNEFRILNLTNGISIEINETSLRLIERLRLKPLTLEDLIYEDINKGINEIDLMEFKNSVKDFIEFLCRNDFVERRILDENVV